MLECIYFFIIGAFAGWLLECMFKFIAKDFRHTPGILNTPFCILYGLGTVVLSLVINRVTDNTIVLFIISMVVLSVMEYVTFVLLKKIYNVQLWSYDNMTFNLDEKVCLEFSLIWGLLGALYIKYLLPVLSSFFAAAQGLAFTIALYLLFAIILTDFVYSSYLLIKEKKQLQSEQKVLQ